MDDNEQTTPAGGDPGPAPAKKAEPPRDRQRKREKKVEEPIEVAWVKIKQLAKDYKRDVAPDNVFSLIKDQIGQFPDLLKRITPLSKIVADTLAEVVAGDDLLRRERIYRDAGERQRELLAGSVCPVEKSLVANLTYCEMAALEALRRLALAGWDSAVARNRAQVYGICQKAYTQALRTLDEHRLRRSYLEGLARGSASKRMQALPAPDALSGNPPPAPIDARPPADGVPQAAPEVLAGMRDPGGYGV